MIPAPPSRTTTAVGGTVVSASVQEVRWRAETTTVRSGTASPGTNGTATNGTHTNGTAEAAAPEASTEVEDATVGGEPEATDTEVVAPPKKKRWFRRNK